MSASRRTQAERSADTRDALIAAARTLFATHGYAEVALETIVRDAGMTRGALYHHFADKTELFTAVFERVDSEVNERIGQAIASADQNGPLEVIQLGASMWLDAAVDPEVQRIVLVDAPAVLGWERWNEVGNNSNIALVQALLTHAIDIGAIPAQPVDATAHTLLGAMSEAALYITRADDPTQARRDAGMVIERMIRSLATA